MLDLDQFNKIERVLLLVACAAAGISFILSAYFLDIELPESWLSRIMALFYFSILLVLQVLPYAFFYWISNSISDMKAGAISSISKLVVTLVLVIGSILIHSGILYSFLLPSGGGGGYGPRIVIGYIPWALMVIGGLMYAPIYTLTRAST